MTADTDTAPRQPGAKFCISATLDGFPFTVEFTGSAQMLSNTIARLMEIGAQPPTTKPAPAAGGRADMSGEPPICQNKNCSKHGQPLQQGDYGWRCSGKDPIAGNKKGYCQYRG